MVTRLLRWLLAHFDRAPAPAVYVSRGGECICGREVEGDQWHLVVAGGDDDDDLGLGVGGTFMSADFCPDHCPGGCRQGCAKVVA